MNARTNQPATRIAPARDAQLWLSAFEASATRQVALYLVGIRDLKQINDLHGREVGNAVIAEVGNRLVQFSATIPGARLTARLPGREYLVIVDGHGTLSEQESTALRLLAALAPSLSLASGDLHVSPRIGIAVSAAGDSGPQLLAAATSALAAAYAGKGKKFAIAHGASKAVDPDSKRLDRGLRQALTNGEIAIVLQPQFDVATGRLTGAEALARWLHPDLGEIGAGRLFDAADRCDLREELSLIVQRASIEIAAQWPRALESLRLSINLGAEELADDHASKLLTIVGELGFAPGRLTVELTEESILRDRDAAVVQLERLRQNGVRIAIDDFGTGYSSLAYLKSLPLDYLKLDKAMTADIAGAGRDRIILRAIIALGKALGLAIIAEGVERQDQLDLLRAEGCDLFQGYLRSPPLAADEFVRFALACI